MWVAIPSPGGLPNLGIEPRSPILPVGSLVSGPPGKPLMSLYRLQILVKVLLGSRHWRSSSDQNRQKPYSEIWCFE